VKGNSENQGIKEISECAVQWNTSTSLIIPEGVETIGNRAFANCSNLTNVVFPSSLKTVQLVVFISCENLVNVTLGNATNWQVSKTLDGEYEDISSTYDLTDGSVVVTLFKSIYNNYYWKRV